MSVGDDALIARKAVVVATGSSPLIPPIDGLREAKPWTNREATTAKEVPGRLAILGGGVVGVEMAQAYSSLGSDVTLIERGDRLIPREERFASDDVEQSLRENGVDVRLGTSATAVRAEGGEVTLELDDGGPVRADELLVAIGRKLNTEDIGLDSVGLEPGKPVEVDDSMRANDWLYAIGDANGRALLTHMGKYQARIAADVILGYPSGCLPTNADGSRSPRVIFSDPHVAAVGYTLRSRAGRRAERPGRRRADPGQRGSELLRPRRCPRDLPARGRRRPRPDRRRHLHRPGGGGVASGGDDRRRGGGADRPAVPCGAAVPHAQRGLALPARGARVAGPCGGPSRA